MMIRSLILAASMALISMTASASSGYQRELMRLDADAQAFAHAPNFVSVDPDSLTDERYYAEDHFPATPGAQTSVRLPDADLDAMTRAILIIEAHEAPLPHVRYLIRYTMNVSPDFHEAQHDYVEVVRFNLGPTRRADVLDYVPAEHVAPPSDFGIGPHVAWRFAMAPVMGMRAGLMYAGRSEVHAVQAKNMYCLGEPCLSLADPEGPGLDWNPLSPPQVDPAPYVDKSPLGSTRSVRVMQELWESVTANGMDPLPYRPAEPHFVFVVSVDVVGQDASALGLAKQAVVMDHSIKEIWTRRAEASSLSPGFSSLYVPRN